MGNFLYLVNCQNAPVINFYGHEVVCEMTKVYVCLPELFEVHPCISNFFPVVGGLRSYSEGEV